MQVTNDTSFHLEVVNWHVAVTSTEISKCLNKCLQDLSILGNDVRTFFNFPLSQEAKYSSWQSIKSLYVSLSNCPFLIIKLSLPRNAERNLKKEISPRKKTITNLINIYIDFNDIDYFSNFRQSLVCELKHLFNSAKNYIWFSSTNNHSSHTFFSLLTCFNTYKYGIDKL